MTKRKLIERILRILKGGDVRNSTELNEADVEYALNAAIAEALKLETINVNLPFGSNIPIHQMIATYESIAVTDIDDCRSKATLPATPMTLPMQLGVWRVYSSTCPDPFIPLEPGMLQVAKKVKHNKIAAMLGQELVAYEVAGKELTFNRTTDDIGTTVTMQLLVSDVAALDEDDQLPLPPDLENRVVNRVLEQFGAWRPHDDSNDNNDSA